MDTLFNFLSRTKSKWEETWGTDDMDRVDEPCEGGSGVEHGMIQERKRELLLQSHKNQNRDKENEEMLRSGRRCGGGEGKEKRQTKKRKERDLASLWITDGTAGQDRRGQQGFLLAKSTCVCREKKRETLYRR